MTERRLDKPVVVLDVIEPGVTPDYCCHGRSIQRRLHRHKWHALYERPDAFAFWHHYADVCVRGSCRAIRNIPPDATKLGRIEDHLRADGPHE